MKPDHDDLQLQRFLDGVLDPAQRAAFAARLQGEPSLQKRHDELVGVRALCTATAAATVRRPRADFTAGVLAAARQLPSRQQLQQADALGSAAAVCRRLLFAAAILFALGLVVRSGLFVADTGQNLHASPDDVRTEMERLDGLLQCGGLEAGGLERPGSARAAGR